MTAPERSNKDDAADAARWRDVSEVRMGYAPHQQAMGEVQEVRRACRAPRTAEVMNPALKTVQDDS